MNERHLLRRRSHAGLTILGDRPKQEAAILGCQLELRPGLDAQEIHDRPVDDDAEAVTHRSECFGHDGPNLYFQCCNARKHKPKPS
jgi:hypothetical protein